MWIAEVEKHFGFTPAMIGGGKVDTSTSIVVGNIQTLQKYSNELSREFGLVVIDEAHHTPQSTFDKVLNHSFAKYKIGLSGTLIRKDGKHVLFKGWFGDNIIVPKEENVLLPTIYRTYSKQPFSPSSQPGAWANQVTQLYQDRDYIMEVVSIQTQAYFAGYVPLITSDRVEFSKVLFEMLEETTGQSWGLVIAETADRGKVLEEVKAGKRAGIVATTSIFSEGLSLNNLSCAILTSSSDNESLVRQIIGRVQRIEEGKRNPIVIDLALKGPTGYRHQESRQKVYRDRKFPLKYFDTIDLLVDRIQSKSSD